jgi:hypothetical protein
MTDIFPPIVVSLRARNADERWNAAKSWFGGLPRLGQQAWPRGRTSGKPLPFAAQLDLAEIAAANPNGPLPSEGSLAFFLDEGAVVYVPPAADQMPTNPPGGGTPAFEPSGELFPQKPSPWARMSFPRWPVEFTVLELGPIEPPDGEDDTPGDSLRAAMNKAVLKRFERRQFFFGAKQAFESMGENPPPCWWYSAQSYAELLKVAAFHAGDVEKARRPYLEKARAEVARLKPKLALGVFGKKTAPPDEALAKALKELERCEAQDTEYRRQLAGFGAFIAEAEAFASGRAPWDRMTPDESQRFKRLFVRGHDEFSDIVRFRTPHRIDDLATETLLVMATGDDAAFSAMPAPIRDLINVRYRLPSQGWHQMFGLGVDIQGNAAVENEGNHLLLQLMYDDMIAWRFGDMGAFQFWISPKDLASRNWSGVKLTFECH